MNEILGETRVPKGSSTFFIIIVRLSFRECDMRMIKEVIVSILFVAMMLCTNSLRIGHKKGSA